MYAANSGGMRFDLADGFPMDELRSYSLATAVKYLEVWPTSRRVFLPNGRLSQPGGCKQITELLRPWLT